MAGQAVSGVVVHVFVFPIHLTLVMAPGTRPTIGGAAGVTLGAFIVRVMMTRWERMVVTGGVVPVGRIRMAVFARALEMVLRWVVAGRAILPADGAVVEGGVLPVGRVVVARRARAAEVRVGLAAVVARRAIVAAHVAVIVGMASPIGGVLMAGGTR